MMQEKNYPSQWILDDSFERSAALSGMKLRVASQRFRGGRVTAVLSGVTLDLRDARLSEEGALLSVQSALSGISVLVPSEWEVVCEVDPHFGGVEADRPMSPVDEPLTRPKLRIVGSVVAGGLHIR